MSDSAIEPNQLASLSNDDIKEMIEERISAWTFLPKENSYPLRVLHFELEVARQNYEYFGRNSTLLLNEPLAATVVLYLSDVSQGGQILFPKLEQESSQSRNNIWSDCTKSSNTLRPTKGNAILFFNTHPNASPDMSSSHARCPVNEGEMWCATKFFYLRAITKGKVPLQSDNSDCIDEDDNCLEWAAAGECQKNPVFMIGTSDYYGTCRKSCNVC